MEIRNNPGGYPVKSRGSEGFICKYISNSLAIFANILNPSQASLRESEERARPAGKETGGLFVLS